MTFAFCSTRLQLTVVNIIFLTRETQRSHSGLRLFWIKLSTLSHCSQERITNPQKHCRVKPMWFLDLRTYFEHANVNKICQQLWNLGGATIIFSQNWNFELKFVLVNPFWEKMTYRWLRIHFLSKYGSKMPPNQTVLQQLLNKKTLQNMIFGQ